MKKTKSDKGFTTVKPKNRGSDSDSIQDVDEENMNRIYDIVERDLKRLHTRNTDQRVAARTFKKEDDAVKKNMDMISEQDYIKIINALNHKQKAVNDYITGKILKNDDKQRCYYIAGGAGCGKSTVLKAIVYTLEKKTNLKVQVASSTGLSAHGVGGRTVHSMLGLPIRDDAFDPTKKYQPDNNIRNNIKKCKSKLGKFETLFIDEISMVSYDLIRTINVHLQIINENYSVPFGGINVIFCGDLLQLPPVSKNTRKLYPFRWNCNEKPGYYEHDDINDLWKCFEYLELDINMRQGKDNLEFLHALNALRIGKIEKYQVEMFRKRLRVPERGDFAHGRALRIFPTNRQVNEYNNFMRQELKKSGTKIYDIQNVVRYASSDEPVPEHEIPFEADQQTRVSKTLSVGVGFRIMLTINLDVSNGLYNGSLGTVMEVVTKHDDKDSVESLKIGFDDIEGTSHTVNKDVSR